MLGAGMYGRVLWLTSVGDMWERWVIERVGRAILLQLMGVEWVYGVGCRQDASEVYRGRWMTDDE